MSRRKKHRQAAPAASASFASSPDTDSRRNLPAQSRALIANARNDITIPFYSGRMTHIDDTLITRGGGKGLKIYDEIERDTWAGSALEKRKKQLTAREWKVVAASETPKDLAAADFVRGVLKDLPFDRICEDLLDATLKGFAIAEVVWTRIDAGIVPEAVVAHDQRRFAFDEFWQPRLLTLSNMYHGEELPARKFIVHRYGVKGNNPYGLGLGSSLFWPVLFKREGISFWLHFLDKFAGPTVVAETPFGSLPEVENRLLNAITEARTSSAILAPIGSNLKFLEASRSGSVITEDAPVLGMAKLPNTVVGDPAAIMVIGVGRGKAVGAVTAGAKLVSAVGGGIKVAGATPANVFATALSAAADGEFFFYLIR